MPVKISSADQLQSAIDTIQAKNPDCRLLFRGQCHNIAPLPSAQRHVQDLSDRRAQSIFHSSWDHVSSYLIPEIIGTDNRFERLLTSMALLQHYGFRSWFVDVTSDPQIAAWFALHKYVSQKIAAPPKRIHLEPRPSPFLLDRTLAVLATAHYRRNTDADGFLFVFGISGNQPNGFLLDGVFSPSALRVHRQKAGELIHPLDGQPLSSLLIATFIIDRSFALPEHLDTRWLFPPPSEDEMYKKLLRVPYVVPEEKKDDDPPLALPYLIDIPVFLYDDSLEPETLDQIRVLIGLYGPTNISHGNRTIIRLPISRFPSISYNTAVGPPNTFLPMDGINVNLRIRQSPLSPVKISLWTTRRLLLLYPIHQMLPTFIYRESVYPLFRGLFVDIEDDHRVHIAPIAETLDYVKIGEFIPEDAQSFLEDFYFLTERIESGDAILKRKGHELHYEWLGWEDRQHKDPLEEIRRLYSKLSKRL